MFEALSDRFEGIFGRLRYKTKLDESDVDEVLREIRLALLEADVNLGVVRNFQESVKERATGAEIHKALNPSQQVIKIVHEELVETLGGETMRITYASKPPTVVLMAGLQGAGKTTNVAKLAQWFKSQGRNPLLVGADLQRPAAVEQLRTLGERVGVPVFSEPTDPVEVAAKSLEEAKRLGRDVVIVDTAGRLSIDEELMQQVADISAAVNPDYTFLVIDAMTGQDAVNTAEAFHNRLSLDGVIVTKLDGDARGGVSLSVKDVVGRPIAFASTGEGIEDFEQFHPDRYASRILGMGDMLSLIEKAEQVYDEEEAEAAANKILEGEFTLDDFLAQMQQLKKMGPLSGILGMMPGIPKEVRDVQIEDSHVARIEAIIRSMTPQERAQPEMIEASRRERIALGSGTQPQEVSQLVKQFREMQRMMKRMSGFGSKKARPSRKARKAKKTKGGNPRARSGRVTPKRGAKALKSAAGGLALPGLDGDENVDMAELLDDLGLPADLAKGLDDSAGQG